MADESEDAEEHEPAVELGEGADVEGAPLARVTSRLHWPQQMSEVVRKEGETVIRTPAGPQPLADVLEDVEESYFGTRQDFAAAVREVIGTGPIPTE